ncbi:hypothetical protein [Streptomyces cellostaticus]|uniref:hypothetical protein n=1 Tax=Streptomyces cellostaticus TaxID=67285 RepID=UPI0020266FF6|nr:hypothetical protein [Streptomyces cellostaticus]
MRKFRTTALLIATIASAGLLGAGAAHAGEGWGGKGGDAFNIRQSSTCTSHDLNADVLGEVGVLNGLGGNLLNGEGNPGAQATTIGSTMGCNNSAF